MKYKINILFALFAMFFAFTACDWSGDSLDDCLVGEPWRLEKTVYYDGPSRFDRQTVKPAEYGEVSMKFYYGGDVSIRTETEGHFGRVYEDWFDGHWTYDLYDFCIYTSGGDYCYEVYSYSHWNLILQYMEEDQFGTYLVEEYYSR